MKNIRKVLLAILAICITVPCVLGVTIGGKKNGETNGVLTEPMQIVLREADDDEKIRTVQTTSAGYRVYYGLAWNQRF